MRRLPTAAALLALLALAPASLADPTGRSTLQETVRPQGASGFVPLVGAAGEAYVVRRGGSARARSGRADRRRSVAFFAQLTDPQIADEMSPARVDFVDPAGGALKDALRPQESLGLQVFDAIVRNVNRNRRSRVSDGRGRRARLRFALTTGDLADNQQLNETRWFRTVLDGGRIDPFSGKPVGPDNPCSGSPDTIARLNADVAARRYTGLQDYDDWRGAPTDRYAGYWDPDEAAPTSGPYAAFPRYPGLLERAQVPFDAQGLDVPWIISRGNHDGLLQGNAPASTDLFRAIAVGCTKIFPSTVIDPAQFAGDDEAAVFERFNDPAFIAQLLAAARAVPPDPDRRIVSKAGVPRRDRRARLRRDEQGGARGLERDGDVLRAAPQRHQVHLDRHGRRGRRLDRQPRRSAVPLAAQAAAPGGPARRARDRVRPPHARDDEQRGGRRGGRAVQPARRARLRHRPALVDADPPRPRRRRHGARAARPAAAT